MPRTRVVAKLLALIAPTPLGGPQMLPHETRSCHQGEGPFQLGLELGLGLGCHQGEGPFAAGSLLLEVIGRWRLQAVKG